MNVPRVGRVIAIPTVGIEESPHSTEHSAG